MIVLRDLNSPDLDKIGSKGRTLLTLRKRYPNIPALSVLYVENEEEITKNEKYIYDVFDELGVEYVAVRSCASVEDGDNATFAGLFETRLNVTRPILIDAIRYVYCSRYSHRISEYRKARELDFTEINMSIIIQVQVNSTVSGVCLSRYDYNRNLGIIEACWGLGESLVQGRETPDRFIFDRRRPHRVAETSIGNQLYMASYGNEIDRSKIESYYDDIPIWTMVPAHKRLQKKLTDSDIKRIAGLALKIESEEEYEVADIEFAISNGDLFLLQARPGPKFNKSQRIGRKAVSL